MQMLLMFLKSKYVLMYSRFEIMFSSVSITPFGTPVVPLVNIRNARSFTSSSLFLTTLMM